MKTFNATRVGQRVKLFDMVGTYEGIRETPRSAKNACNGASTIQLETEVVGLIRWDENPDKVCTISAEDFEQLEAVE